MSYKLPVICLSYTARTLWLLGYPDQALKKGHEALTLAREHSNPLNLAYALAFAAAWLHQLRREGQAAQEEAEASTKLSTEHGFAMMLAAGTWLRGWALAEQGQREEGLAQIHQGLAAWQATGAELWRPYVLTLLAEAYGKTGQTEEGLAVLVEALATVDKTGERLYEAELYRLKGELTLAQSSGQRLASRIKTGLGSNVQGLESEAEGYFLKAIEWLASSKRSRWSCER